jgi:hypothetical protein
MKTMLQRGVRLAGLTFLEVLLSLSLLSLLLVAGSTVLFSFSQAFFSLETAPQYERHADGVTEFLHYLATHSDDPNAPAGGNFGWEKSPASEKTTLSFRVDREIPFFVSELRPLPSVRAFLEYDEENGQFWLSWYPDPALTDGKPEIRYTLLSPWAKDIEYGYYDAAQKSWEFELASSDNRQRAAQRPETLRILFERAGEEISRDINLKPQNQHVLSF